MTLYSYFLTFFVLFNQGIRTRFLELVPGTPQTWQNSTVLYLWRKGEQFQHFLIQSSALIVIVLVIWFFYYCFKQLVGYFTKPFFANLFLKFIRIEYKEKDETLFVYKFNAVLSTTIVYLFLPFLIPQTGGFFTLVFKVWENLIIWKLILVMVFLASRLYYLPSLQPMQETLPLKGILQTVSFILYGLGGVVIFLRFANLNLSGFLTGIGALSAVLILVFQDTLLNLTATFRLYSNQLIKTGDWIEVPTFDCEGAVVDVTLSVIKVQNFDMSVSSFSPRSLIGGSFKNWSNMSEKGARRSKQLLWIDLYSVMNLTKEQIALIKEIPEFKSFWETEGDALVEVYKDSLSNVRFFRSYMLHYLKSNPVIHPDLPIYVRNREVTDKGLPIQILFYSLKTQTQDFEEIQADILEHAFAVVRNFYLIPYQSFSGRPPSTTKLLASPVEAS